MIETTAKKPNVFWLSLWLGAQSLLTLIPGLIILLRLNRLLTQLLELERWWVLLIVPFMGIGMFVSAILVRRYKRIGLKMCIGFIILQMLMALLSIFIGENQPQRTDFVQLITGVWAAYYAYRLLTKEPEKSFFN